jgi:Uma2 family endonuclease
MNLIPPPPFRGPPQYPERDGKPLADNTQQARWIVVIFDNLLALFHAMPDVFIAADLLWYAVEGDPGTVTAPDVLVVFGRPRGDRGSYRQWEEDNVPVTVAFEILSPNNTRQEMADKLAFYDDHGGEEYYLYDPDKNHLTIYRRQGQVLRRVRKVDGFVSPRLRIRFDLSGAEMVVYGPDGQRFLSFEELQVEHHKLKVDRDRERQQRIAAEERADRAQQRAARLADLSRKARRQQASPEELQELERLENESAAEA